MLNSGRWSEMMRPWPSGLAGLCLALSLIGCASQPQQVVVKTRTVVELPPSSWVRQHQVPEISGETNGDLLDWAVRVRASLLQCNADKSALADWRNALTPEK